MAERNVGIVRDQVLFGNVSDVVSSVIFGKEMVVGLVLARANFFRDRFIPFFGIRKLGIDIEDNAPEGEQTVTDDLTDLKPGFMPGNRIVEVARIDSVS